MMRVQQHFKMTWHLSKAVIKNEDLTVGEALDVIMHVHVVDARVVLEQGELVGHADDGAAQLAVDHLEVLAPEVLELL